VLKKTLLLILTSVVLFDFTGCAMSAQARRERAYRHYVAKQTKQRQKAIAKAQKEANREMKRKMKNVQPSEPYVTTAVQDYQEMPSVFDQPAAEPPAPSANPSESVAPPVTVSASNDINVMATQNPDQPSPP
jgi:regulator of protease activity HflC (stomatin/prohibitin superfamily)